MNLGQLALELVETLARRREREAVGLVLRLVPARADAELDATARDVIDGDCVLREHRRRAERDRRDERAEPDPCRRGAERRQRRPRVERSRRFATQDRAVMVGAEEAVEPCLLGRGRESPPLLPLDPLLTFEHQADPHPAKGRTSWLRLNPAPTRTSRTDDAVGVELDVRP